MDETSKIDASKLASQIKGNCGDDPEEEFHSHSDEVRRSAQSQFQFGDSNLKKSFSWLRNKHAY